VPYDRLYSLRQNESVTLYFDDTLGRAVFPIHGTNEVDMGSHYDIEHGPYKKIHGTSLWQLTPDLTTADWEDGLDSSLNLNTTSSTMQPAVAGTARAVYHMIYPYPLLMLKYLACSPGPEHRTA